jgi:uncharacterized protein
VSRPNLMVHQADQGRGDAAIGPTGMGATQASAFHPGEREAQRLAGMAPRNPAIRDWMTDQHRSFFAALPFILAATADGAGWPVATMLTGKPGFIASPDPRTLRIATRPQPEDPAAPWFVAGAPIGLLGIDLATRRRNRANGVIAMASECALVVAVQESFGNCPQYIHPRELLPAPAAAPVVEQLDQLDDEAVAAIRAADTLFVATSGRDAGVDISHRAGRPGFVRVDNNVLTVPDFAGNRYFNTIGNMLLDPRTSVLFPAFASGDLLHAQGLAEVVWNVPEEERLAGAERLWRLHITGAWRQRAAVPLRWELRSMSPGVARTGVWEAACTSHPPPLPRAR